MTHLLLLFDTQRWYADCHHTSPATGWDQQQCHEGDSDAALCSRACVLLVDVHTCVNNMSAVEHSSSSCVCAPSLDMSALLLHTASEVQ